MSTEFNELLPLPPDEKGQVWIVGSRDWVNHKINEFYVRRLVSDRFALPACGVASISTPITPAPFAPGKFMSVLEQ